MLYMNLKFLTETFKKALESPYTKDIISSGSSLLMDKNLKEQFITSKIREIIEGINPPSWLRYISSVQTVIIIIILTLIIVSIVYNFTLGPEDEKTKKATNFSLLAMNGLSTIVFLTILMGFVRLFVNGLDLIKQISGVQNSCII